MSQQPHNGSRLARIDTFDALLAYLRDELDWPIDDMEIDDLTFDYEPEELGLDPKVAAKIRSIKQLRPLDATQPFGIFFVEFEPKRLPVTALRRILGRLVTRKRESANPTGRATWKQDDLIFISAYGEDDSRRIDFAHFADDAQNGLPTLRVLGWDKDDTPLRAEWVETQLRQRLLWPDDADVDAWREQWRAAFVERYREAITTASALAVRLADLARDIRSRVNAALAVESDKGPLTTLMKAFRESLIHDLEPDDFADMYAQTIAYGLLSARVSRPAALVADNLADMVPVTNPFLKELMETFLNVGGRKWSSDKGKLVGIDFDELGVNEVVDTLRDANMEAVLRDFDNRNPQEDPVLHFYEHFLKEYDAKKRIQRGVFYTPKPVVSYIVRSVHELLQTEFGLPLGLADTTTWGQMLEKHPDLKLPEVEVVNPKTNKRESKPIDPDTPFVQILDPATGTATFLVEVIDVIHRTMMEQWESEGVRGELFLKQKWNEYVPRHLLPRLHGYELMMAPYAIAHMKIGLKLFETGYSFEDDERARVYLTNALEPPRQFQSSFDIPALAHEAEAVNRIKRSQPITVVIGNPPYSGISSNMAPWIDGLLKGALPDGTSTSSYYHVNGQPLGERKLWLQDDYVKFIRWSQWRLQNTNVGVHGFITNHGYLDNPTFRGMRWSLMEAFDEIRVLDLHGNLKKKETPPDGGKDVNVFDIQQGVGVGLFVRKPGAAPEPASVRHADLWGERSAKYNWLIEHSVATTAWEDLPTSEPFYLFEPFDESEVGDYYSWPAINEAMPINVTGIVTARDDFVIDIDRDALMRRMADLHGTVLSDEAIRKKYFQGKGAKKYPAGDSRGWKLPAAREKIRKDKEWRDRCAPILYRPFDVRHIYYVPWIVDWPRTEAMPHMLAGENLAIITCRQQSRADDEWAQVGITNQIAEGCAISNVTREINYIHPLYLYPNVGKSDNSIFQSWPAGEKGRRPNLDPGFIETIGSAAELEFVSDGRGDLRADFGPEDALAYIYAIFHSPEYRRRFEPMLKLDFPRVPPPTGREPFASLVPLGHELLALHLLESPLLDKPIARYTGAANPEVDMASYTPENETVWIDRAQTRGFIGVPEAVWNFHIGGYQVCHKWLKDRQAKGGKNARPGRVLTDEDTAHYCRVVTALHHTIRLMGEIDEAIEAHGGWPGAFVTEEQE